MSHNWTKNDLAAALRLDVVAARSLLPGDVVVDDDGPWRVTDVKRLAGGRIQILDQDGNGYDLEADARRRVVARSALRVDPRQIRRRRDG
jgi:hypothetical protein